MPEAKVLQNISQAFCNDLLLIKKHLYYIIPNSKVEKFFHSQFRYIYLSFSPVLIENSTF